MSTALYYLGLAFLFTHELDAVTHAEWRLLPALRLLPDATASPLFVSLHVLLFFAIIDWTAYANGLGPLSPRFSCCTVSSTSASLPRRSTTSTVRSRRS